MAASCNSVVVTALWNCTFSSWQCWECVLRASSLAWAFQLKGKSSYLVFHGNVQQSNPINYIHWFFLMFPEKAFFFFFYFWHSFNITEWYSLGVVEDFCICQASLNTRQATKTVTGSSKDVERNAVGCIEVHFTFFLFLMAAS